MENYDIIIIEIIIFLHLPRQARMNFITRIIALPPVFFGQREDYTTMESICQ